jgi:hypothetical protein
VYFGSDYFRWETLDLMIIAISMYHKEKNRSLKNAWILRTKAAHTVRHVQSCRQIWSSRRSQRERDNFLLTLNRLAFATECSDPRDLVYAFLSLQISPVLLPANYALSVEQVYASTCLRLAASSGNLDILGMVRHIGNEYGLINYSEERLPSWAIDWRYNLSTQGPPLTDGKASFAASGAFKYKSMLNDDLSLIMTARGGAIDSIGAISHTQLHTESSLNQLELLLSENLTEQSFGLYSKIGVRTVETQSLVYRQTLKALLAYDKINDNSIGDWDSDIDERVRETYTLLRPTGKQGLSNDQMSRIRKFESMASRSQKKRLFLSLTRHLFGLCPQTSLPGDKVCILHGSSVPVVLRKVLSSNRYIVIGQCYMVDWMHGDYIDWKEDDADTFELE